VRECLTRHCAARAEKGDEHREKEQVQRDVDRSLNSFFQGSESQREAKRQELARIINGLLATHPDLYYYQVKASNGGCATTK
jgi:hypothetical protein